MLAQQLAERYHTLFVPEVARSYLSSIARPYEYEDLMRIAKEQFRMEEELIRKEKRYLFCDTDFIVLKIWSYDKFRKCDPWILEMVKRHRYDLYLLMDIDLPWEPDPQREDPDRREFLFSLYQSELDRLGVDYYIISGRQEERVENAVRAVGR
ncbi:MAG: ATP-binding protein [Lentimicrobiaceae bacterium]|nr:ATP-binding protein [Lentimicrobiaceae bacterium]